MAPTSGDRSAHFPAIEKKHGKPASFWLKELAALGTDAKYADQISFLRERHGFSQAHANALVMHARGSTTSKRFASIDDYLKPLDGGVASTVSAILDVITSKFPGLELVIAWNQPMLRSGKDYVFGLSAAKKHILLAPMGRDAIARLGGRLDGLEANKKTVRVPVGWKVDKKLLHDMVRFRLTELDAS